MVMYKRRFWWLPLLLIVALMVAGFTMAFARIHDEGRDRCKVITAIIDYAAPRKPLQIAVPPGASPDLREVIERSNERAVDNNHKLRAIADEYLPRSC